MSRLILNTQISLFLILCVSSLQTFSQNDYLNDTKWVLIKLEKKQQNEIILPSQDYTISFESGSFGYQLEKNSCGGQYLFLHENLIRISNVGACTRICCDGDISNELVYGGEVKVSIRGDILKLEYEKRVFTFKKI